MIQHKCTGELKIMDDREDVSGAGNMMGCDNEVVREALTIMNDMRAEEDMAPLGCSNRATGAAENWSDLACDACVPSWSSALQLGLLTSGSRWCFWRRCSGWGGPVLPLRPRSLEC